MLFDSQETCRVLRIAQFVGINGCGVSMFIRSPTVDVVSDALSAIDVPVDVLVHDARKIRALWPRVIG